MTRIGSAAVTVRIRGLTLVELLIALVMGLILLGGLATVFIANKTTYRHQDGLARLQENGRFALALLERDIRRAGAGQSMAATLVGNTVVRASAPNNNCDYVTPGDFPPVIDGFDDVDQTPELAYLKPLNTYPKPVPGTDAFRVTVGYEMGVNITKDAAAQAASTPGNPNVPMDVSSNCGLLYPGLTVYAVSADGNSMARFVINSVPNCDLTTGEGQFHHGGGIAPEGSQVKNCTHKLGPAGYEGGYLVGTQTYVYYIARRCETCVPSLYRSIDMREGEELVEGVEDMQIMYGRGQASTRVVDQGYANATTVGPVGAAEWDNVRSARVQLLLRAPQGDILPQASPVSSLPTDFEQTWGNIPTCSGCWRQVYSTTVGIRNRLP